MEINNYGHLYFKEKTKTLIDSLKSISANCCLGNEDTEFKIITQVFLYKLMNDKFAFEIKKLAPKLNDAKLFDDTLLGIAITNNDIFSVKTEGGAKAALFKPINDGFKRNAFAKACYE